MIEIKREKTAQPTISADDIHYDAARRSGKASALTDRLGSVQKSDVFLSQSYRSGPPRNFAFRLRNALRRSIARSCRDNSAQDTELAEGIAEGKALYLQAEACVILRIKQTRSRCHYYLGVKWVSLWALP